MSDEITVTRERNQLQSADCETVVIINIGTMAGQYHHEA